MFIEQPQLSKEGLFGEFTEYEEHVPMPLFEFLLCTPSVKFEFRVNSLWLSDRIWGSGLGNKDGVQHF